jgi:hypothetical protein
MIAKPPEHCVNNCCGAEPSAAGKWVNDNTSNYLVFVNELPNTVVQVLVRGLNTSGSWTQFTPIATMYTPPALELDSEPLQLVFPTGNQSINKARNWIWQCDDS